MTDRVLILSEEEAMSIRLLIQVHIHDYPTTVERFQPLLEALDADPLDGWQPGKWWQVIDTDIEASDDDEDGWRKALWCETSDEAEARLHMRRGQVKGKNMRLQHQWRRELAVWLTDEDNRMAMSNWRQRRGHEQLKRSRKDDNA